MNISTPVFRSLIKATNNRIPLLKQLPQEYQAFFRIEGINILDKWDEVYTSLQEVSDSALEEQEVVEITDQQSNWMFFYMQFFGEFFEANQADETDAKYSLACIYYMDNYYTGNAKEDREVLFFNAFPTAKR